MKLSEHEKLVRKAIKYLEKQGFKKNQIEKEYEFPDENRKYFSVDVVGISKNKKIAIECGTVNNLKKFNKLKEYFDEVINFPYLKKMGEKMICNYCKHIWNPRIQKPKECPKCKRYLHHNEKEVKKNV